MGNGIFTNISTRTLVSRQLLILTPKLLSVFLMIGILLDAIDRTNLNALWRIVVTYAFGAFVRVDLIDFLTLRNCLVRAFRFAYVAIDTLVGNNQSHGFSSFRSLMFFGYFSGQPLTD
jgi:hypothetical protein